MNRIEEVFKLNLSPKEQKKKLTTEVINGKIDINDFVNHFVKVDSKNKNSYVDVFVRVSSIKPELLKEHINLIINYITFDSIKVKWAIQETIGNLALIYPKKIEPAIPLLLKNTKRSKSNTTVVRSSAAYALTEILKDDKNIQRELLEEINEIIKSEDNQDIINVYLNALKLIDYT